METLPSLSKSRDVILLLSVFTILQNALFMFTPSDKYQELKKAEFLS